eukprot:TRINITY_DN39553_c0_g1_i1.p1 TRINITY_DN39553_c0_g1~~TRINITY_DN39553_c0_g1_i1.p1  ORF type:complete len:329 (-),score=55.70 TRINITY_DN39553_c0_g1_i1:322-1308(-)
MHHFFCCVDERQTSGTQIVKPSGLDFGDEGINLVGEDTAVLWKESTHKNEMAALLGYWRPTETRQKVVEDLSWKSSENHTAPSWTHKSQEETRELKFAPGKLGLGIERSTLTVDRVDADGQAYLLGVENGWTIISVEGLQADQEIIDRKVKENMSFVMTFRVPGEGTVLRTDGTKYVGNLVDGQAHGHGLFVGKDACWYHGQWKSDRASGHGVYKYSDGSYYEGQWVDDQCNGQGTLLWPNNYTYSGQFVSGARHGQGELKKDDGSTLFSGQFTNGQLHGQGSYRWADGSTYTGQFKRGVVEGFGSKVNMDGTVVTGKWKAGKLVVDK